jgi:Fe-S-cluster-containing dehydrogenase component
MAGCMRYCTVSTAGVREGAGVSTAMTLCWGCAEEIEVEVEVEDEREEVV